MRRSTGLARGTRVIAWVGLALLAGSAPAARASVERGTLKITRSALASNRADASRLDRTSHEIAIRRAELRRAIPDRLGVPRRAPWVTGRRAPLVAPIGGSLERTSAFSGAPDTVRVLGLRIDFETDRTGTQTTTPDGRFDARDGQALGIVIDPPPHNRSFFVSQLEAMARYWRDASHGDLVVEYDVYPKIEDGAYRLGDTGDYGPWTLGQASYNEAERFFREAVIAADAADNTIPFGSFDVVILFHAGSDFQADVLGDSPRDIPTFHIGLNDSVPVNGGTVGVHGGIVMPETENQDGYYGALNGTMAHEFGHALGLPDLYDINTFFPAVGVWSNMDSGYLLTTPVLDTQTNRIVDASGLLPVSLDPWCKTLLWPDGVEKVDPGRSLTTTLRSSQISNRILRVPLGADEYLLVENRQYDLNGDQTIYLDRDPVTRVILGPGLSSDDPSDSLGNREWDFLLPGQGVLAWHVDETVLCIPETPMGATYNCGWNPNPDLGVNSNPNRLGLRVLEADGIKDIGDINSAYFFGGPFDPYFVGNHTKIGDDTNPTIRTNDGGRSHVKIDVTSAPAIEMGITVDSEWRLPGWPVSAGRPIPAATPTSGSLLHDGRRSVVLCADSLIFAWMADGSSYYTARTDGEWAALPAPILGQVLFADSLYRVSPSAAHGAAIVATTTDGNVHAFRPAPQTDPTSIPLAGWPPVLDTDAPSVRAVTPPVLAPRVGATSGAVLVGGSDGRVFSIASLDNGTDPPIVNAVSDTLIVAGNPVVANVSSNLAVGRFTGAGGYHVAYALQNGVIRIVEQLGKGPARLDRYWIAGAGPSFDAYVMGVDVDRAPNRDLEVVVLDREAGVVHCFDLQGNELPGWPVRPAGGALHGALAAGDMDGDGYPEVFAVDNTGVAHRWNRNGIETVGWPIALTQRFGSNAVGGAGSPILGDVDGDGLPELVLALDQGLVVALESDGTAVPGWPISVPTWGDATPLLCTLNGTGMPPNPPGPAWLHLVNGGRFMADDPRFDGSLVSAHQLPARVDSALVKPEGVSARTPWPGYGGDRRHSSVLDDGNLGGAQTTSKSIDTNSIYCFPNPARGAEIGVAYTLGTDVTEVEIRVLDPMGMEVRRVAGPATPTQNVARISLQDLASGVYMVRIEARRAGSTEVAFQKFAVVR